MEHIEEHLSVRDTVLVVIAGAGGLVEGRTTVQKLAYFAGLAIGRDLGHHAHFYGPYSRAVESALVNESFAGDLEESVDRFPSWSGPDIRQYTYKLTAQGEQLVRELRKENPRLCAKIEELVHKLQGLVPEGLRQHPLSLAAKVDYIASHQRGDTTVREVPKLARELGWSVSREDVQLAVDILVGLGRVRASGPQA